MEWDRRTFVKLAVGSAAGFLGSPLLLKVTDDLAIWTQNNWSWVPKPDKGEVTAATSVNPATGTGVRAKIIESRLSGQRFIRVEGNPDHPVSKGGILPADASALQLLYNKAMRLSAPTIRDSKGSAPHAVSWENALGMVSKKLAELKKAGTPEKLVVIVDDPDSTSSQMMVEFLAAFGSPNLMLVPKADYILAAAGQAMFGQSEIGFDLENADYVVSFGTPLLENFGAPVATRKAFAAWRSGPKKKTALVQVEPYSSVTAGKADTWLACKPGSEGLVALGLCHLLIKAGAYDAEMAGKAFGFEDSGDHKGFKSLVLEKYTPAKVAAETGISPEELKKVAQAFASAKAPLAVCGPDNSGGPGRLYDFMSVLALNTLRGRLGKKGGIVLRQGLPLSDIGNAPAGNIKAQRLDFGPENPLSLPNLALAADAALCKKPYAPEVVIVVESNPCFSGPQAGFMSDFLSSVPLTVAITPYLDETAFQADVALPAAAFLESWGDCTTPYGSPRASYGIHKPLIQVEKDALPTGDIILALAKMLGGDAAKALPYESMKQVLQARTKKMGKFNALIDKTAWVQEKIAYGDFPFKTPSKNPQFNSQVLAEVVLAAIPKGMKAETYLKKVGVGDLAAAFMPHFEKPALPAEAGDALIMSGIPSLRTTDGSRPMSPYMIKILYDTTLAHRDKMMVEMNPETAGRLHLAEGDEVIIASVSGSLEARVHLFHGAAPGMVMVPRGLGHSGLGMYLDGIGANFQQAVALGRDALSCQPQWSLTAVKVSKAAGGAYHG